MESPVASFLWRSLRVCQIFGANTDVGKTIFTTFLGRAAKREWQREKVAYLKPVSTGLPAEADHWCNHISRFAPGIKQKVLFEYDIPVSPHAAALASGKKIPSDNDVLTKCREYAADCASNGNGWLFIETAGGVHSPGPSGNTQADIYIPLRAPVVLIGDSRLGGISQTISAFESLHVRGYDVEVILLLQHMDFGNHTYLENYFQKHHGIPVLSIASPPHRQADKEHDAETMGEYYARADCEQVAVDALQHLHNRHDQRIASINSLARRAHQHIWYPFTQQSLLGPDDISTIDSAHGDYFQTLSPSSSDGSQESVLRSSFDGSASWWTQGLGHSNPRLTLAAAYAAGRYGHVMFAGSIHEPAMSLASTLLSHMRNPRLSRVFYSDNGSTGTEVAVKMGLRAARLRYGWGPDERLGVLGLKGGYHGDTIGAMDMSEPCAFNEKVEWYEGKGYWFDYPTVLCKNGRWLISGTDHESSYSSMSEVFDLEMRESRGEHKQYEKHITKTLAELKEQGRKFGALIIEPIVLGAGGMHLVDPLFQRTLVNVVRQSPHLFITQAIQEMPNSSEDWSGLPVIFDEVFTGLYRLGRFTPSSFLGVHPDITVHAKLLTGGLIPLCATLASESIFEAFSSPDKTDALLHGHSYTAHPIGCQVALRSLQEMRAMEQRDDWNLSKLNGTLNPTRAQGDMVGRVELRSVWPQELVDDLSRLTSRVDGVWALGSVLAIHLKDSTGSGYTSNAAKSLNQALSTEIEGPAGQFNIQSRVLGNVLYLMSSQVTSAASVAQISKVLLASIK